MIVPNDDRVLVKQIKNERIQENILMPGQLKVGENLYAGEIVHTGNDDRLRIGQLVYFSEFSAASIIDVSKVLSGELTMNEAMEDDRLLYVLGFDDIMAYDDTYDAKKISAVA